LYVGRRSGVRPTKPFEIVTTDERFVILPTGKTVLAVAEAARSAALEFCTGAQFGWGRGDLGAWLGGSYRDALLGSADDAVFDLTADADLDDATIAGLVARARAHVADMVVTAAASWRGRGFAREMIDAGFVVGVTDPTGGLGYAPQNRAGGRLADRVTSLFLADFLTRPRDYESLVRCATCDEISFEWDEVHAYDCGERGPESGIVVKRAQWTRIGLGARLAG
jgi:hypothetical protein